MSAMGAACLIPAIADAQQAARVYRIGFLGQEDAIAFSARVEAMKKGLRDAGYEDGKNLLMEYRWAGGRPERLLQHARELVGLKPDVVITHGTPAALALKQSTSTIPIVVAAIGDAVAVGIVDSLARPGGNITGSTFLSLELYAKRIDLLREALPRLRRLAFHGNVNNPSYKTALTEIQRTTAAFKVEVAGFGVGRPEEIDAAFVDMAKRRIEAVSVAEQVFFLNHARLVVAAAQKHRLPLIGGIELAEAGALIGYGTDLIRLYYRTAYFVDKILKVARPRDLPVEQASKFDLVINLKAAKALGIRIPASLVQRADRVIE